MEILPLGVGEAFAKTLYQTNFLVTPADGEPFLIDFGHTASRALCRLGVPLRSVSGVVISHLHADHIGGLEELGFSGYFGWRQRPRLLIPENLLPFLWEHALSAGMGQRLQRKGGGEFDARLDTYFEVIPIRDGAAFELGSVTVRPFPTPHAPGRPSWGFQLEDQATRGCALITCDSRFAPKNLERFGQGASRVFHDCQLSSNGAHIHATLDELLTLERSWQEKILLVHYSDDWQDFQGRTGAMRFARQGESYRF